MGKTIKEYAASHSVDTYWYAIDKDNRLVMIDSGEEGWIPADKTDPTLPDDAIINDALIYNSEEIEPGLRKLHLNDEQLATIEDDLCQIKGINKESYAVYNFDGTIEEYYYNDANNSCSSVIKLSDEVYFTDLSIWKTRIKPSATLVLELSAEKKIFYCRYLKYEKGFYYKDVESGKITAEGYFDPDLLYYSYRPRDDFATAEIIETWDKYGYNKTRPIPFTFKFPENFHNLPKYDISLATVKEFNIEDYTGIYCYELENWLNGNQDRNHMPQWNFEGKDLEKSLFLAIKKHSSVNVWTLIDKLNVSPLTTNSNGETAIEYAKKLLDENRESLEDWDIPGIACLRIYNMLKLKEKQLCNKSDK